MKTLTRNLGKMRDPSPPASSRLDSGVHDYATVDQISRTSLQSAPRRSSASPITIISWKDKRRRCGLSEPSYAAERLDLSNCPYERGGTSALQQTDRRGKREFKGTMRRTAGIFRVSGLLLAAATSLVFITAAQAEWYIAKVGGETFVPLEELGADGRYHSAMLGVIHTPENYIHVLGGPNLELTPEPNTLVGIIKYKLGDNAYIMFFNNKDECIDAWARVGH
jgi:hypothetical protein